MIVSTSLKNKAVYSVAWSAIERFSVQGIQFVLSIIIARLVLPSDYGLIAMLGIFLAIAQTFIDSGFSNALIQKQNRTEIDFSTVFYFNIVIGITVYLILYLCSSCIATFYSEPKLDLITKIVGLNLVISSFSVVQRAKLTIDLNFKLQAVVSLIAVVISGVIGVYLACNSYGVWALVFQNLLNNLLNTIFLCIAVKWLPKDRFSYQSFKLLFSFGSKLLLSGLLHTIYTNIYSIVIGKKFSAVDLGYYNRSYTIAYFPSNNISNILSRAIYPIQCSIQNDTDRLRSSFMQYMRMSAYIVFPLMIGLCVLAKPFVYLILTEKWLPMVPLLQIMCIAYMWDPIMGIHNNILNAKGRSDLFFKAEILKKIAAIIILIITIPFGIQVMCFGLILYAFCDILIITRYTKKIIGVTLKTQIITLFPVFILNFTMGIVIHCTILLVDEPVLQLLVGLIGGAIYYGVVSYFIKIDEAKILLSLLKKVWNLNTK